MPCPLDCALAVIPFVWNTVLFPAPFLAWLNFPPKSSFQESALTLRARRGPSLVSQGTQHVVLAKTTKTSSLKMIECPLDVSLRVNLPIHSGEAHGRMDLRMRPSLLLDSHTELLETRASRRLEKGQVSPQQGQSETRISSQSRQEFKRQKALQPASVSLMSYGRASGCGPCPRCTQISSINNELNIRGRVGI